jgi:hypothetical protein
VPVAGVHALAETGIERILEHASTMRPRVIVADSVQTLRTESLTAAPGTSPPPSTRSNSAIPEGQCAADSVPTDVIGRAARDAGTFAAATAATGRPRSITLPQTWHSGQRPYHLAPVHPHSLHA